MTACKDAMGRVETDGVHLRGPEFFSSLGGSRFRGYFCAETLVGPQRVLFLTFSVEEAVNDFLTCSVGSPSSEHCTSGWDSVP